MIKAKAGDMELVAFCKANNEDSWTEVDAKVLPRFIPDNNYFLCLLKHREACLHWLNGGLIECNSKLTNGWEDCAGYNEYFWKFSCGMMREDANYRIKPCKETRYVVIHNAKLVGELFKFDSDIRASYGAEYHELQIFKIEVEV